MIKLIYGWHLKSSETRSITTLTFNSMYNSGYIISTDDTHSPYFLGITLGSIDTEISFSESDIKEVNWTVMNEAYKLYNEIFGKVHILEPKLYLVDAL